MINGTCLITTSSVKVSRHLPMTHGTTVSSIRAFPMKSGNYDIGEQIVESYD